MEFVLPTDVVVADKFAPDANTQTVEVTAIPDGWMVSRTAKAYAGFLPADAAGALAGTVGVDADAAVALPPVAAPCGSPCT